ncbi:hypothetical protein A3F36_01745 [Candidatus Peribacteria bacterium RIFCSPHIGHO2_12_FULL_55_11]|nr:MAG: hypothetical protein A3F36_01745 [Candidatus Peribacteria bacterium RIFCSPHIGHO2_12_FULL_55_11]
MAHLDLEETFNDDAVPKPSREYPEGYYRHWSGAGTTSAPATGKSMPFPDLGSHAIAVAQSRNQPFYFSIEDHNFCAFPNGVIEEGIGGQRMERRKEILGLLCGTV